MKIADFAACMLFFLCLAPGLLLTPGVRAQDVQIANAQEAYTLGVSDEIRLTVFGEEALSGSYTVGSNGAISMPLIGEITLAGLSTTRAEALIRGKLADGYLIKPSVSIEMLRHRPFYILGEVHAPGSYDYASNMNVLGAVAVAGGFTYRANRKNVQILRAADGKSAAYKAFAVEAPVAPGDTIVVGERLF
jgi:polysaccharide export outer membrane protein